MAERIGIMQGRLLPPINGRIQAFPADRWPEEFELAQRVGFGAIEFVFDGDPWSHPLLTRDGIAEIRRQVERSGVLVESVCADYFMSHPLHGIQEEARRMSRAVLDAVIGSGAEVGVRIVVLPCVDSSSLCRPGDRTALLDAIADCLPALRAAGVVLALETDLGPPDFSTLLAKMPPEWVGVNYDTGNSASLGFDPAEEFDAYGRRVVSVHVKDRKLHSTTVPLGSGDTDFRTCFARLKGLGYSGPLTIQGARGADDVATAARYLDFVRSHLCVAA